MKKVHGFVRINMKDDFRRLLDKVGKGGVKCSCCNPYSRRRDKRSNLTRVVRSRLKKLDIGEIDRLDHCDDCGYEDNQYSDGTRNFIICPHCRRKLCKACMDLHDHKHDNE